MASPSSPLAAASAPVGGPSGPAVPGAQASEDHEAAVQITALLIGAFLLRLGVVGGTDAIIYDLTDLAGSRPNNLVIGLVGASVAVSEMSLAFVLARYADRFGRSRFLVGGPLLGMAGMLIVFGATHPAQFAGARVLEGIGAAAFVPTALGTIAAATAHSNAARARASGAFEGATLAGYAGGFLLGGFAWHAMHHYAFLLMAGFYLVASLVCARFVPRVPPLPISPVGVILRAIVGPGPIRRFIPAWLAVNCLVGAWYINMTALLKRAPDPHQSLVHGFDERLIAVFKVTWVLLLILGIVLWTPYLQRHGGPATMRRAVPGAFVVCAALFVVNHAPLRYSPIFLTVAVAGVLLEAGFVPAAVTYLADCSEALVADRSALMAFYTVTLAGGGAIGAAVGGLFAKLLLFDGLLVLGVLLGIVAVVSLQSVVRFEARATALSPAGGS